MSKLDDLLEQKQLKKMNSTISIQLSAEQILELKKYKSKYKISMQQIIAAIIEDYLK